MASCIGVDSQLDRSRVNSVEAKWDYVGNEFVTIVDDRGNCIENFSVFELLRNGRRFFGWGTNGLHWREKSLAYIINFNGQAYLSCRTWWGDRFLIALERLEIQSVNEFLGELEKFERLLVVKHLEKAASDSYLGNERLWQHSNDSLKCDVEGLAYVAGDFEIVETIPLLRAIENSATEWQYSTNIGGWDHNVLSVRRTQRALRQLGQPASFPVINFSDKPSVDFRPEDYANNRTEVGNARPGMKLSEVYLRAGPPDYCVTGKLKEHGSFWPFAWRYDVDIGRPYTILLWLDRDPEFITRVKKYHPPFWRGIGLFSESCLICHDGSVHGDVGKNEFYGSCVRIRSNGSR